MCIGGHAAELERQFAKHGVVSIPHAKLQAYHMTLGVVDSSYPIEDAVAAINARIPPGTWTEPEEGIVLHRAHCWKCEQLLKEQKLG
jgi:hypothetical protein